MQNNITNQQLPGRGNLQVSVFAEEIGLPVDNATVLITQTMNESQVIYDLKTDSSGQTPVVDLPAPPIEYSLEPETEIKPYSEFDITVTSDDFIPVNVKGVQILPDTTAKQNVRLTSPVTVMPQPENIIIDPHTLWYNFPPKIPEDPVKPLPESLGFVVLPNPVVPEYMVVHNGVPTDTSAPNYYIPFKDYIKNVASCEIYSTWPVETIEANILAIISFALNRVYTEWYRGKGFDFTITNSTAYDQAFVYGRNIFNEISVIVDYLFTTFITKPNIRQPLFTQFCDGVNTSCPNWLQQWGSKYLGDQGYDAVDILKYYYGQDIFLLTATKVSGVPSSYPGTPLQVGSTGQNVRTIQEQLNAISDNFPAIGKLVVDGIFGPRTKASVTEFQKIFGLPQTGVVDFATWYEISNIYVSVEKLAEP